GFFSKPYIITISRFIEVMACVVFAHITYLYFLKIGKERKECIVIGLIKLHYYLSIVFSVIFLLAYLDVFSNEALFVLYDQPWDVNDNTLRLRGFFVEGGPFGLMLAMIFNLTYYYKPKYLARIRIVLFITILFFAQSKSGLLCIVFWYMFFYWNSLREKVQSLSYFVVIPLAILFIVIFSFIGKQYIDRISNLRNEIELYPNDGMLLTGRTSAFYIASNMIIKNPLLGVGYGNYIYNRNKEIYRDFVPKFPEEYILPRIGLGGIFTLVVENGLVGLALFCIFCYSIYVKFHNSKYRNLILLFFVLFLLGVELTFAYPYFLLGIVLSEKIQ